MSGPLLELQAAIRAALIADVELMAMICGVYDEVENDPYADKTAFISFGPWDVADDDAGGTCLAIEDHAVQLDIWSKARGTVECKAILDRAKAILKSAELELVTHALSDLRVTFARIVREPSDGESHGVLTVEAEIEVN